MWCRLESEINEWAEPSGVECAYAEHKGGGTDDEGNYVLSLVVLSEIHLVLDFQAKFGQGEEREESSDDHRHIQMGIVAEMKGGKLKREKPLDEHP